MKKQLYLLSAILMASAQSFSQVNVQSDMNVTSAATTDNDVLRIINTYAGAQDRLALRAYSSQTGGYGIGGLFQGGYIGVQANADVAGGRDNRTGGLFVAANAGGHHKGVFGYAASTSGPKQGVYGAAEGGSGPNYGVYGQVADEEGSYAVLCHGPGGYTDTWLNVSDINAKKDITPISSALEKVMKLKPIYYQYDLEKYPDMGFNDHKNFGFSAQDVEQVFPEVVSDIIIVRNSNSLDAKKESGNSETELITFKGIDYIKLVPVLCKAIQEQQKEIDELKAKIKE
jgi:hypothetical protein